MESLAGAIILLTHWRRAATAFAAGAVLALTLPPLDIFPAGFLAFPILVWLLDGAVARPGLGGLRAQAPAFWTGWWFGFGYFVAGLWWLGAAVLVDAEHFAWALPLAVLGLPALLAVFFGVAAMAAHLFWHDGFARILALACAFAGAEWLRGILFTGFPWNALGMTIASNPLFMQAAAVAGSEGLALVAVLLFAAPAVLADRRGRAWGVVVPALGLAALAGWGFARPLLEPAETNARTLAVRLVQPSIIQTLKWDDAEKDAIFETLMRLTKGAGAASDDARPELVVWPETALPFLIEERPQALALIGEALDAGQMLLTGAIRVEGESAATARYYNSVLAVDADGNVAGAADKVHLVPFGEYLPLREWLEPLGLREVAVTPGAFSAGPAHGRIDGPAGVKIAPLICYEVIFPGLVRAQAAGADLLINVTNDAWYGVTPGPYQHFRQAQLRAVETGRPVLRVANNGLSGAIDPFGRVSGGLALNAVAASDLRISLQPHDTVQARHGRLILLAMVVFCAFWHMISRWASRRRRAGV